MEMTATPKTGMEADIGATAIDAATSPTFEDFYAENCTSVARALAVTLGDGELAADAMNEAMTRAYQRWSKISRYDNPAAWVYRVGMNWALSWKRRRRRERDRPIRFGTAPGEVTLRDDSLDGAVASLSVEHRAVVVCRVHLDWSVAQTAVALDIKPGTVKSRLARALEQLKQAIETAEEVSA